MTIYESALSPTDAACPFPSVPPAEEVVLDCLNMLAASLELDTATDSFLETLGCFYQAACACVFELEPGGELLRRSFVWHDPDRASELPDVPDLTNEDFQLWFDSFESEGMVSLLWDDPGMAIVRRFWNGQAMSAMAAPLYASTALTGFLCVVDPAQHMGDPKVLLAVASMTLVELRKLQLMKELERLRPKALEPDVQTGRNSNEKGESNHEQA